MYHVCVLSRSLTGCETISLQLTHSHKARVGPHSNWDPMLLHSSMRYGPLETAGPTVSSVSAPAIAHPHRHITTSPIV